MMNPVESNPPNPALYLTSSLTPSTWPALDSRSAVLISAIEAVSETSSSVQIVFAIDSHFLSSLRRLSSPRQLMPCENHTAAIPRAHFSLKPHCLFVFYNASGESSSVRQFPAYVVDAHCKESSL